MPLHVRLWTYDGTLASGVAGPIDVLTAANSLWTRRGGAGDLFEWRVESPRGEPVKTASGQLLATDGSIDAGSHADALILTAPFVPDVGGFIHARRSELQVLYAGLRRQHARGTLIGTYCNGSHLLAEAGLLEGRVATTHWGKVREFRARYPGVDLQPDEVLTEQDRIVCAGAVTAYLNLALRIVERLADAELAASTARLLLIDVNRVSQASYATFALEPEPDHGDALVARAQRWMQANLGRSVRMGQLASEVGTSERTLNRRFKQALGEAPLRHLQELRIEAAKDLLASSGMAADTVSGRVGYEDPSTFRQLFKRVTGLSPREYQRRFGRRRAEAVPG